MKENSSEYSNNEYDEVVLTKAWATRALGT
jgi:hypothetical protein